MKATQPRGSSWLSTSLISLFLASKASDIFSNRVLSSSSGEQIRRITTTCISSTSHFMKFLSLWAWVTQSNFFPALLIYWYISIFFKTE